MYRNPLQYIYHNILTSHIHLESLRCGINGKEKADELAKQVINLSTICHQYITHLDNKIDIHTFVHKKMTTILY